MDHTIQRLLQLRFKWDREDGITSPAIVPACYYCLTQHCLPYRPAAPGRSDALCAEAPEHGEEVTINGVRIVLRDTSRHSPIQRRSSSPPTQTLGSSGIDTIPTLCLDASLGPLLCSSHESLLTARWKSAARPPTDVARMVKLRQRLTAASCVALPPQSVLLLLKCVATMEMDDPALDVALAIALGEAYYSYDRVECLEALRCLRRVAVMRSLATISTISESSNLLLYDDASLPTEALGRYVADAAPFLAEKVWARLPEQSRQLLQRGLHLDWVDLISLAVEMSGNPKLPGNLPGTCADAYAQKYHFLRYSLRMDADNMEMAASGILGCFAEPAGETPSAPADDSGRDGLVLWLISSLWVRLAAEALGDILTFVAESLRSHAQLAEEMESRRRRAQGTTSSAGGVVEQDSPHTPSSSALPRPPFVGSYQRLGRRGSKQMRVRMLPFEAFLSVFHCHPRPFRVATPVKSARTNEAPPVVAASNELVSANDAGTSMESPFAAVLATSPQARQHVERASEALRWATMILHHAQRLTAEAQREVPVVDHAPLCSAEPNTTVVPEKQRLLVRQFVASKVQMNLDALFCNIAWAEMGPLQVEATTDVATPSSSSSPDNLSLAEQDSRRMLSTLVDLVDDFQVAVADLLEVHDVAFGDIHKSLA